MPRKTNAEWYSAFSPRFLLVHPATWFAIATIGMIFGAVQLWERHPQIALNYSSYELQPKHILVNQPPEWAEISVPDVVMEQFEEDTTLLNPQMVPVAAAALEANPWVEKVVRIEKNGVGLTANLNYRTPVAVVEVIPGQQYQPVDAQAVIMDPGIMKQINSNALLKISVLQPKLAGQKTWTAWQDQRIADAASICKSLDVIWQSWGLYRVVSQDLPGATENCNPFELWTGSGRKIIWGSPPGFERQGEANTAQKIAAIQDYVQHRGAIAKLSPGKKIDVRGGTAVIVDDTRTARRPD